MIGPFKKRRLVLLGVGEVATLAAAIQLGSLKYLVMAIVAHTSTTLGLLLIYGLMKERMSGLKILHSKVFLMFVGAAGLGALEVGALQASYFALFTHFPAYIPFITSAASGFVGYVVFTPFVLILVNAGSDGSSRFPTDRRTLAFMGAFCLLLLVVFAQTRLSLIYLVPLGLMLLAYTVEIAAVAAALLLTVIAAAAFSLIGLGPTPLAGGALAEHIAGLQLFLAVIAASTMTMAALITEHARLKQSLIASRGEAEAANQAKSVFLATMSHEIRTPLNGVLGMTQVLAMKDLSESQRECVEVISRSGQSLLSLLNDVLDLSKIEAGKLELELIDFDLGELMRAAARNYASLAQEKGISLGVDFGSVEGVFKGDPVRIRQILFNLISNALKFTESGEIHVASTFDGGLLTLSVSDSGMGIPADKIDKLFSKFSQVDESTTRRFGGTGLGLSICRELVELMGGTISVKSQEGVGSTFTVTLGLERIGDSLAPQSAPADEELELAAGGLRVLAAEDNPTNQLVLKTLLEQVGVDVTMVGNGAEAVEAWAEREWDVILMDVQMPVQDGPSATREIRRREAESDRRRTPIVALTANTMTHQITQYVEAGMDAHVAKPINAMALFEVIGQVCDSAAEAETAPLAAVG